MRNSETKRKIQLGETAATIVCDESFMDRTIEGIASARKALESYIGGRPDFAASLEPVEAAEGAPEIVRRMCSAGIAAGVGPMAAVAGAIAYEGVRSAVEAGCGHCVVDNGGDIAMILSHPVTIGILENLESHSLPAFEIESTEGRILGLCTSSGVFGHSISFGKAEAATVMAVEPALADACATALGNACKDGESVGPALMELSRIDGVLWAMAVADGRVGMMGDVPRIVPGRRKPGDVTVHSDFPVKMTARG